MGRSWKTGMFSELPGDLAVGVGKVGAVVPSPYRCGKMATQLWVFTPNPLKSGTDILAHRSARSFGMRSGFVIAAPTPYGSGKLRVEEVQLAPEAFRTPEIIEAHGFRQFLVQLAKPASIVALGMLIERISR